MGLPWTVIECDCRIHHEVAGLDGRRGPLRGAAQMGADAGQQFLNAEGLGDVVVGAGVEGLDLGALVVAHGEDQHRSGELSADGAADLDAAHAGHHQVGDDQVGRPVLEDAQALLGIVGGAHVVALRGERGAQHARNLRFVVDDQNSARHVFLLSSGRLHHRGGADMILV